jgi:protoporphyrinogen oxidase
MGFLQAQRQEPGEPPKDFEQFCHRHFGDGFSRHFMIPYNCRLWGVHPREITAEWCSRFVPLPKLEDVIAGAVGLQGPEMGYNAAFLYPRRGIGDLTSAFARSLGPIECGRSVVCVDAERKQVVLQDGERIDYEVLVTTAPLNHLVGAIQDAPQEVRRAAGSLRCSSLHYLDVALDVPSGRPFHWVYVPEERYPFYRVGVYSNFSSEMAPEGKACMYIELADRRPPELDRLVPEVASGLVEMGFIERPDQVRFAAHRTIEHAYVIYDHAYYASLEAVQAYLKERDILSTGRYGGWNYSSMEDALLYGRDAARRAGEILR